MEFHTCSIQMCTLLHAFAWFNGNREVLAHTTYFGHFLLIELLFAFSFRALKYPDYSEFLRGGIPLTPIAWSGGAPHWTPYPPPPVHRTKR